MIEPDAMVIRGFELTAEEHAARAAAVSRGWIAERDGQYFASEAGRLTAKRSRAATGKSRTARMRSAKF